MSRRVDSRLIIRCIFLVNLAELPGQLSADELEKQMERLLNGDAWSSFATTTREAVEEAAVRAGKHLRSVLGDTHSACVVTEIGISLKESLHTVRFHWKGANPQNGKAFARILYISTPRLPGRS